VAPAKPGYQDFYVSSAVAPHAQEAFTLFLPWVHAEIMILYLEHWPPPIWIAQSCSLGTRQAGAAPRASRCPKPSAASRCLSIHPSSTPPNASGCAVTSPETKPSAARIPSWRPWHQLCVVQDRSNWPCFAPCGYL
jgi:hypothetical protein